MLQNILKVITAYLILIIVIIVYLLFLSYGRLVQSVHSRPNKESKDESQYKFIVYNSVVFRNDEKITKTHVL